MHPEAERLATAFIRDFWAPNHEIKWEAIEIERLLWLSSQTVLVGKCDAIGTTPDGQRFFGDWKTASKNKAGAGRYKQAKRIELKQSWKMEPQALTYGLLNGGDQVRGQSPHPYTGDSEINCLMPEIRYFTVRWAFKTEPAETDFEWYEYSEPELTWWKGELLDIADDIRSYRSKFGGRDHWPTNLRNCTRYGVNYPCPFREGCHAQDFSFIPAGFVHEPQSHLDIENTLLEQAHDSGLVVLDASRVADWLGCRHHYKKSWEDRLRGTNEDLIIGTGVHTLVAAHLKQIKQQQEQSNGKV